VPNQTLRVTASYTPVLSVALSIGSRLPKGAFSEMLWLATVGYLSSFFTFVNARKTQREFSTKDKNPPQTQAAIT
jgi:hypothetical protein